jgi:hypothetical protein
MQGDITIAITACDGNYNNAHYNTTAVMRYSIRNYTVVTQQQQLCEMLAKSLAKSLQK